MLSSVEQKQKKQQQACRRGDGGKRERKERVRKEIKRDGMRRAERRKARDKRVASASIWNMFTVISLDPDVIAPLHLVDQNFSSNSAPSFSTLSPRKRRPAELHSILIFHVRPSRIRHTVHSVSLLYTLRSALGPFQSNKGMMGSGLVHANINSPPCSSKRHGETEVEEWAARLPKVRSFVMVSDKCGHRNSSVQSSCIVFKRAKLLIIKFGAKEFFSERLPSL